MPCCGANYCGTIRSVKSPSAVKHATFSALAAAGRSASNGSIPMCRCGSSPETEGILTRCVSCLFPLPLCGPDQVLIEVKAAGMNFRDVLKALALYPGEAPDARIFGDEVAGIVKSVGAGVTPRQRQETGCLASRRSDLPPTRSRGLATCGVSRPIYRSTRQPLSPSCS